LAALLGFRHAFETDDLPSVSNIVTKRNAVLLAMKKREFFWAMWKDTRKNLPSQKDPPSRYDPVGISFDFVY
jgi:hypothetical protein